MRAIAAPIFAHLKKRNGKVKQMRRHYKEVRKGIAAKVAEHKDELARVQAENVVLRGGSLS